MDCRARSARERRCRVNEPKSEIRASEITRIEQKFYEGPPGDALLRISRSGLCWGARRAGRCGGGRRRTVEFRRGLKILGNRIRPPFVSGESLDWTLRLQFSRERCARAHRCTQSASQKLFETFLAQARVPQNTLENLRVESFRSVKRNSGALTVNVFVDHVAAALPRERKPRFFQCSDDFSGGEARELRHHTATSTVERLTETCSEISSPSARRSSMCSRMASLMFSTASSYVSPWL